MMQSPDLAHAPVDGMTALRQSETNYTDLLHAPGRAQHMEDLEEHLNTAAGLARAIWNASQCEGAFACKRDREAFERLADILADHVTAALYAYYTELEKDEGKS